MTTFMNDETKAYLDSLTPIREMGSETICDCSTCGKGLTCADVDDIPPADFHEDYPDCLDCIVKRKNARTIAVLEAHGAVRKDSKWRACVDCEEEITVWWEDAEGDAYCAGCYTDAGFTCDGCHNEECVQCNEDSESDDE